VWVVGAVVANTIGGEPCVTNGCEIATFKIFIGEAVCAHASGPEAESLIGKEKECPVFAIVDLGDPNGGAKGRAKVVLRIHGPFIAPEIVEPVVGVKGLVPQIVIAGAVQLIGSGFHGQVDDAIAGLAVFRGKVTLQNAEFIYGVRRNTFIP